MRHVFYIAISLGQKRCLFAGKRCLGILDTYTVHQIGVAEETVRQYPGFDPEIIGVGASMGVDKGNYPTSKKIVFGVNVTF